MSELAKFHDRQAMQRASERFVRALVGEPKRVENVAEPRLSCGHAEQYQYVYKRQALCRLCRADEVRASRLPDRIEATRLKLIHLEREAKRRGQIK